MSDYCVYCHVFPNGKLYVGITCQKLERRWRHGKGYEQNIRMTNAIQKYGWENIQHLILADNLTIQEAEDIERKLIDEWELLDSHHGYNYAPGGIHPRHTEATKKKIGERSKGRRHTEEFKAWISDKNTGAGNYMYGRHHSEDTKQKISEAKKGKHTGPNKGRFGGEHPAHKEVEMINLETGEVLMRFKSYREAAAHIHRCPSRISEVTRGIGKSCGGYGWRRAE